MRLTEINEYIKNLAIQNGFENFYFGKLKFDESHDISYPCIINECTSVEVYNDYLVYNFNIYAIDRLTQSRNSRIFTQDEFIIKLSRILNLISFDNTIFANINESATIHLIDEDYTDNLAGAVIRNIRIRTDNDATACPETAC